MQSEFQHKNFGRGRNISCNNYNCENFRKKIGRVRSLWSKPTICPICHEEGYQHSELCKVSKDNKMMCECHLKPKCQC